MEELTGRKWSVSVALGENLPKREHKKELRSESDQVVHNAADVFGAPS